MSKLVVQSLKQWVRQVPDEAAGQPDAQLLRRFIDANDHRAFEILLDRHGPMVLGTGRRLVNNVADADDVFQAVFLSLARLAKSIRQRQSVPNWLYTTTCRIAAKARKRRVVLIENAPEPSTVTTAESDLAWREVRTALDEELRRLPDRLRLPLLLCYLSGLARDEAAEQLGWSVSTLKRRLEEGRSALRRRLERRGISAAGLALAVLSPSALDAAVRPELAKSCLDSVRGSKVPAEVSALTLTTSKTIKGIVMKVIIVALALVGLGVVTYPGFGHADPPKPVAEKKPEEPKATAKRDEGAPPELITLKGHTGEVESVCFSPDGKRIVTGGGVLPRRAGGAGGPGGANLAASGEVKVWDAEKGTEILDLKGHTCMVSSVCFRPDGKRVASAGSFLDQTVRVWDAEKGEELLVLKGQSRGVGSVCFSPDGKRLATVGDDRIRVWDAEKGNELLTLKAEVRPGSSVCFSPDGKRIASVYPWNSRGKLAPGVIKVWDAEKGEELLTLKGHTGFVHNVTFSPDGKRLASAGGEEQMVRVWDAEKGQELLTLKGHTSVVCSVSFSPDGKRLATASWDQTVKVWDAEKGQELLTLKGHTGLLRCVCFSPDGKRVAGASKDQTVIVWSLDKAK
jgi:RNA polymerase sigma factor (sigma-70 family)